MQWNWRQQPARLVAQPAGDSAVWESGQRHHGRPAATAARWPWQRPAAGTAPSTHYIGRLRTAAEQTSSDFVPLLTPSLESSSRWAGTMTSHFFWIFFKRADFKLQNNNQRPPSGVNGRPAVPKRCSSLERPERPSVLVPKPAHARIGNFVFLLFDRRYI